MTTDAPTKTLTPSEQAWRRGWNKRCRGHDRETATADQIAGFDACCLRVKQRRGTRLLLPGDVAKIRQLIRLTSR